MSPLRASALLEANRGLGVAGRKPAPALGDEHLHECGTPEREGGRRDEDRFFRGDSGADGCSAPRSGQGPRRQDGPSRYADRTAYRRPRSFFEGEIGRDLFKAACDMMLEGLVSKRRDSRYRPDPSPDWIKVKNPKSPAMNRAKDALS